MPSPRQILSDIEEFGLDPTFAHTKVSTTGNLRPAVVPEIATFEEAPVQEVNYAKYALKEISAQEVVLSPLEETLTSDEVQEEQPKKKRGKKATDATQ